MADSISIDTSELRALAASFDRSVTRIAPEVRKVILVGAMKIKKQMRAEMGSSRSFRGTAPAIDFDMRGNAFYTEAVIGPKVGSGEKGGLAGIAYFGNSRGGGTVSDPVGALDAETPHFERALLDVLGGLL